MQTMIKYMHLPKLTQCRNVSLLFQLWQSLSLADFSRPLQMVSVLVVDVLVDDDGPQTLLEVADRLRISQTVPRRQSSPL